MNDRGFLLVVIIGAMSFITPLHAAPVITNLSSRGLQIGAPVTLTIEGTDLLPDPQLISQVPLQRVTLLPNPTANRIQLEVVVEPTAFVGIFPFRLSNAKGVTTAFLLGVDMLPQLPLAAKDNPLPAALHGVINGDQRLQCMLTGKSGQRLVVDVEAQRLESGLRPVIRLFDARGVQIAWSAPQPHLGMDARIDLQLPADGNFVIELHDVLYRAPNASPFRLKIGDLQYADFVFPLAMSSGTQGTVQLFTSRERTIPWNIDLTQTTGPSTIVKWKPDSVATGGQPWIGVSDYTEFMESNQAGTGPQELPPAPLGINGILRSANEEDRFLLPVSPGAKLQFDVLARRAGSPVDGVLSLLGEQGNPLASNDDRPGTPDPGLDFTVPEGVNKLIIALRDLHRRGGSSFIYRIAVRDLSHSGFALSAGSDVLNIPSGSSQVLPIEIQRTGYQGPIDLQIDGLQPGMKLAGNRIPAGATKGLLTISAPNTTPSAQRVSLIGHGQDQKARFVSAPDRPAYRQVAWMRNEFAIAVSEPGPISVEWADDNISLPLGGRIATNLRIQRSAGVTGNIRIRALTSQVAPKKTVKQNNVDVQVDDVDRTLRIDGTPMATASAPNDSQDLIAHLIVPGDLPVEPWTIVIVAELLAADNTTVLASTTTAARQLVPTASLAQRVFEDEEAFVAALEKGAGQLSLETSDKYSGNSCLKVTPDQRFNESLPGLGVKIKEKPEAGEFRYLQFAWKKKGGDSICLQLNHDGLWGPGGAGRPEAKFRYHSGPGAECYGASLLLDAKLPDQFVVVTRDLFADFGEFTLNGLAFSAIDGEFAYFDHIYLGRAIADFDQIAK